MSDPRTWRPGSRSTTLLLGLAGFVVVIAVWWIVADTAFAATGVVPSPAALVEQFIADGPQYYVNQVGVTVTSAAQGWVWGSIAALLLASFVLLFPRSEPAVTQFGVIIECIPLTAIGPIVLALVGGRTPSIFLAAMAVFFTALIGSLLGVHASRRIEHDLVRAYGGNRWSRFAKVQVWAALPAVATALKIAVPAALIGAILGEYLGGVDSGIGVALSAIQRSIQVERTWIFGLSAALLASGGYGLIAVAARIALPWARSTS
ncbi:ABC transporter permease [Leifsonia sp. H3M29-4]|uniref:ABC transporter permease n=1 Tax=Salinibacterium metalliresistens TaxID=3031321 RepID=UPI0023DAAB60|nr:ABC transporter permease subunit [Salinibacterium metalliresistens]MDF1478254.1 ABC transporter permease [Salinibacterium metalliresistens]